MEKDSADDWGMEEQTGQQFSHTHNYIEMQKMNESEELMQDSYELKRSQSSEFHRRKSSYAENLINKDEINESCGEDYVDDDIYHNMQPNINQNIDDKEWDLILKYISGSDIAELDKKLKELSPAVDLTQILNIENGYTLLHLATFKDSDQMIYMLFKHIMERQSDPFEIRKKNLKKWINQKTKGKEGFTALHLAAFNGNLTIIKFLERHGADIFSEN